MNNNNYYDLIYNNIYIKNNINKYLNYYKIFTNQRDFINYQSLQDHKYKEYLSNIFIYDKYNEFNLSTLNLSQLESISFRGEEIKSLPTSLKELKILGLSKYNWSIIKNAKSLETLFMFSAFGSKKIPQFSSSDLPSSITDLYIDTYEYPIKKDTLPCNIKRLELVLASNIPIEPESIPPSTTHLKIDIKRSTNNPFVSNYFPYGLLKLDLAPNALEQVPDDFKLPDTITSLKFKCSKLCSTFKFPSNLKRLLLYTNKLIESQGPSLPSTLEKLYLVTKDQHSSSSNIFKNLSSLKKLVINCSSIPILSNSIQHLTFTTVLNNKQERKGLNSTILPNTLPKSLTYLCLCEDIGINYNDCYSIADETELPPSLTSIKFGPRFNQDINLNKLINLKSIHHGKLFNQDIDYSNLIDLESLRIDNINYDKQIMVPKLTKVQCTSYYKQFESSPLSLYSLIVPISIQSLNKLSLQDKSNLEYLDLGFTFKNTINKEDLPINNNIKTLVTSNCFNNEINLDHFPSLEILHITNYSNPTLKSTTNHYNLKSIIVSSDNILFLDQIIDTPFQKYLNIKILKSSKDI